jgi:hypothetical protein
MNRQRRIYRNVQYLGSTVGKTSSYVWKKIGALTVIERDVYGEISQATFQQNTGGPVLLIYPTFKKVA